MAWIKNLLVLLLLAPSLQNHSISKRYLLFPKNTVLQFTYGLSVPAFLPTRTINLALSMLHTYALPTNLSQFDTLWNYGARTRAGEDYDMDRTTFYEYIVNILESIGYSGESCLLRTVCEISEIPLHIPDKDGLLEAITHYLLTPSLDVGEDGMRNHTLEQKALVAERLGRLRGKCDEIFTECTISFVDFFTNKFYFF